MEVVTNKEGGRRGSEGGSKGVREREGERGRGRLRGWERYRNV